MLLCFFIIFIIIFLYLIVFIFYYLSLLIIKTNHIYLYVLTEPKKISFFIMIYHLFLIKKYMIIKVILYYIFIL